MVNPLVRRLSAKSTLTVIVSILLCLTCRGMAPPDDASALLAKVGETYRQLGSYRFSGHLLIHSPLNSNDSLDEFVTVARSAPDRYRLQLGLGFSRVLVTCDGSKTRIHIAETNQYVETPTTDVTRVMDGSLPADVLGALRRYAGFVERYARFPDGLQGPSILKAGVTVRSGEAERICTIVEAQEAGPNSGQSRTRFWIDDRGIILREERGVDSKGENPRCILQLASSDIEQDFPDSLFVLPLPPGSSEKGRLDPPLEFLNFMTRAEADLSNLTFLDLTGTKRFLSEFKGRLVLLDFWATWCKPCLQQMEDLSQLSRERQQDGLVVLGITSEPLSLISHFFKKRTALSYQILIDDKKGLTNLLQVSVRPTLFVLDSDGHVSRHETGRVGRKRLEEMLKELGMPAAKETR